MPLKYIIDKLEEVDEASRSLYVEKDGKFVLQVEGLPEPPNTSGLQTALQTERKQRAALERQIADWKKTGKTPEEIEVLIAEAAARETSEAERRGEWDKLRTQMNERHASEMKKITDQLAGKDRDITGLRQSLENNLIDAAATSAIAAEKGVPDLLLPHVRRHVKVLEENGKHTIQVVDGKGDPRVNGKGEPLTMTELVSEMRGSEVFGRAFDGTGSSGSGTRPGGGGPPRSSVSRRSDLKTEKERAAFVDQHGLSAYQALPM